MSKRFLLHSLFLISAALLAFFWTSQEQLSFYTLQLTAFFIILFFLNQFLIKKKKKIKPFSKLSLTFDGAIFTMITLLLIFSTGGLNSPLFFLIYFLMFGLALLFEPPITLTLSLIMVIIFLFSPPRDSLLTEAFQLLSLLLITPLALFFSKQYLNLLKEKEKITIIEKEIKISEEQTEKEETDTLLWTTLNLKQGLTEILDQTSALLSDIAHLTITQKERLLRIREKAIALLKSGDKLKEEIDQTTD